MIHTFLAAQEVFRTLGQQAVPELVLIDVNFEGDKSDPLSAFGKRPTGLLYALCLLTWARVMNRPIGIAFHTADAGLWRQCESEAMRQMAVLLVGLNASLFDSAKDQRLFRAHEIDEAVEWLRRHAAGNDDKARLKAAEDFRRCLQDMADPANVARSGLFVDPQYHAKLLTDCELLGTHKERTGSRVSLPGNGVMVYINGEPNFYSVDGLFPAVAGGLRADDFRLSPEDSSQSEEDIPKRESWEFDPDVHERPLVGDYLHSLGAWQDVFKRATETVNDLGSGDVSPKLPITQLIPSRETHADVKQLIAILFQIVNQHRAAWTQWTARWSEPGWQPWDESRDIYTKDSRSHRDWLRQLHNEVHVLGDDANELNLPDRLAQIGWQSVWGTNRIGSADILKPSHINDVLSGSAPKDPLKHGLWEEIRSRLNKIDRTWQQKLEVALQQDGGACDLLAEWLMRVVEQGTLRQSAIESSKPIKSKSSDANETGIYLLLEAVSGDRTPGAIASVVAENRFFLESLFGDAIRESSALPTWLENDLRLLKAYNVVSESHDECGRKWVTSEWPEHLNGIPRPPGVTFVPAWLSTSGLVKSLGFSEYRQVERIEERVGIAKGTVKEIADGGSGCPKWLKSLCVRFALDIGWSDDTGWPDFMQSR